MILDKNLIRIARQAGKIHLKYFKKKLEVKYKTNKFDPVTLADIESDAYIRKQLKLLYPKDKILSEESDNKIKSFKGRVWMVDPLDGTKSFVAGDNDFCIIIGLCKNGVPQFGFIYLPVTGEYYYAQKSQGTYYYNGKITKRINVNSTSRIEELVLITRTFFNNPRPLDKLVDSFKPKKSIALGSAGIKIALIAAGKGDAYIHTNNTACKWDTCGAQVILEEAGGIITDFYGKPLNYRQTENNWKDLFVASNRILHEKIIAKIKLFFFKNQQKPFK